MANDTSNSANRLGELEQLVMDFIWSTGTATAETVREGLSKRWPMKDSTVRTILRRLEEKGFVAHDVQGRTYIYRPAEARQSVATRAVQQVIDRFCEGSVEQLLVGMVNNEVLDPQELERLARKIAERKAAQQKEHKR